MGDYMIQSMSKEQFLEYGCPFADRIEEAFEKYESFIVSGEKLQMRKFLQTLLEENKGSAFADFYYGTLTKEQQKHFRMGLSESQMVCLDRFETENGEVFYALDERNLEFLFEITARNWLFSSFYFGIQKAVVWGNYDLSYPVFCPEKEVARHYMEIAGICGLQITGG